MDLMHMSDDELEATLMAALVARDEKNEMLAVFEFHRRFFAELEARRRSGRVLYTMLPDLAEDTGRSH